MEELEKKVKKILVYIDLYYQSECKEINIKSSNYYKLFEYYDEQKIALNEQMKVTNKIGKRIIELRENI